MVLVGETWRKETREDLGVSGRVILNESARSGMGSMDWIGLAQDRLL